MKKRNILKIFVMIAFLVFCECFAPANMGIATVQAASGSAMTKAYEKYMIQNRKKIKYYAYANIGPGNKKALLGVGPSGYMSGYGDISVWLCDIYYYVGGKVKKLGTVESGKGFGLSRNKGKYYLAYGNTSERCFADISGNKLNITNFIVYKNNNEIFNPYKNSYTYGNIRYTEYVSSTYTYYRADLLRKYKDTGSIVFKKASSVSVPKLNVSSKKLNAGSKYQLKVKGTSQKVSWSSSNKKVATVNASGKVTAKKAGKATIYARVNGKTLKCKITVIRRRS